MAIFTIEGYNSYSGCDITVTASLPIINGETIGKYYTLGSIQTLSISTHQDKRPVRSLGVINAKDYVMGPRTIAGSMVFAVFNKHFATEIMADLGATNQEVILPDEIPALDITVNFANEYGRMSRMAIYGVKLINEGQVMSINDLYTENTYQFVALGLEPLSAEEPLNSKEERSASPALKKYDYYMTTGTQNDGSNINIKDFNDNSGAKVADQMKNNEALEPYDLPDPSGTIAIETPIELSVETFDAPNEDDLGLAVFKLFPSQINGDICIYEGNKKLQTPHYTLPVTKNAVHNMSLSAGDYTAQYVGSASAHSNIVNFTIDVVNTQVKATNEMNYPIVEKVTHDSIVLSNNNNRFNKINLFKTGGDLQSYPIGKSSLTISNLESDTEYNIFSSNEHASNKSDIITVKTFEYENQELEMLKDYMQLNNNLLIENHSDMYEHMANINMKDYNTLIDMVLDAPDSIEKQEALIYATKITNQLIDSYNASNTDHIKDVIQTNPFDNEIRLNSYEKAGFYNYKNKKSTLNRIINTSEDNFYGTANKHYCVYGIDENGNRSIKKDFTVCKNNSITKLENYTNTQRYKDLDLSFYDSKYKLYDSNVIQAMAIIDSCYCDLNLLDPPYIYQDESGRLYADIKYNHLNMNKKYYLVCANLNEALDYTPFRKILFYYDNDILNLNDYYLGLLKGENYLFWIESDNYMKISKPYLFRYHEVINTTDDFDKIRKNELYSKITSTQSEFTYNHGENPIANDLFNYIYDCNPEDKNFNELTAIELINHYETSIYGGNTFNALFELLKITHNKNQIKILPNIKIDKENKNIKIDEIEGYYMVALNYTMDSVRRLYEYNEILYYNDEGYTMVYLMSDSMIYKSGFILIDCVTGNYKCTDELYDRIKEGVI